MAKAKGASSAKKITFVKRKGGKAQKFKGPKDKATKPYNRQGR
jgi:hypothetical protein